MWSESFPVDEFSNQDNNVPIRTIGLLYWLALAGAIPVTGEDSVMVKWRGFTFGMLAIAAGTALAQEAVKLSPPSAVGKVAAPLTAPASPAVTGGHALDKVDVDAWLDGFMPYAIARGDIAGAVVVVVKDGQVLTEKGYGFSDVEKRKPVSPETTLFRPGSVSKLFTWTAVMQLVEQGKIDLDKDVNTYLDFKIPPRNGKPITMRNIMTHTSGFEETVRHLIHDDPSKVVPLERYVKESLPYRAFDAGSTPAYSNYATAVAGYIVQRQSGMSFDDYVDRHIFQPLNMRYASFRQPLPKQLQPFMSEGYKGASGKPEKFEIVDPAPAGSLSASGADMGKFMIAHLNNGAGILKPETAKLMHNYRLDEIPGLHRMALGFYEQNINGHRGIAHGGDTTLFHSDLSLFIDDGVGLFVSVNSAGGEGAPRALRERLFDEFGNRYFPGKPVTSAVDPETSKKHVQQMAGSYFNSRGYRSKFLHILDLVSPIAIGPDEDGKLSAPFVTNTGNKPRRWAEIAPYVWKDLDSDEKLAAKVENGQVNRWSFDTVSPFMMFDRVPWYKDPAWLAPALYTALGLLFLAALSWPAGAIARRRFKVAKLHEGARLRSQRIWHGWQWLSLATIAGWVTFIGVGFSTLSLLGGPLDPLLLTLQVLTPIAFVGYLVLAGWNLRQAFTEKRSWFSRLWAIALLFSSVIILWVALSYHLVGFGTNY
ncbi:beta-lactamase family protein [Sphingomonas sp. G124]|uniref:Beta-lactamase family protein n=1 Tax=Sphingomonas cremea TaxID=2904799 RepID=A0A9X1U685_9SPHN|nr:serine hydrolase domain-containing protein [Sphingomonas cremea]MCF2515906.1 beta-lactamase family protein [Sphingomonas cremea]